MELSWLLSHRSSVAMKFVTVCSIFLLAADLTHQHDIGDDDKHHRLECQMWMKLENKTLPLQNQGHAQCVTNKECTGFTCHGEYQGTNLMFGLRVKPCGKEPGVEIYGYAPQFHTSNFTHTFYHAEQYPVPGSLLNMSMIPGAITPEFGKMVTGILEVHLQKIPERNTLELGLKARACINNTCIFDKPVFNHTEIPVPECPTSNPSSEGKSVKSLCSVNDLFSCGQHQTCVQYEEDQPQGECECVSGYYPQDDGSCVAQHDTPPATTPKIRPQPHVEDSEGTSAGTVAAGVISVLVIILLLGGAAFIIFRTRLAPRLRARLTNKPYEDIVINDRNGQPQQVQGASSRGNLA